MRKWFSGCVGDFRLTGTVFGSIIAIMVISYIALGSNLDSPQKQVQDACLRINALINTSIIAQSHLYQTKPLGPQDQPDYINQVIAVKTALSPHDLLAALQDIENQMGRVRTIRWGARVIDCDILLYGNEIIESPNLLIPHPEMTKRDFVLYPLAEIAPNLVLPSGEAIQAFMSGDRNATAGVCVECSA